MKNITINVMDKNTSHHVGGSFQVSSDPECLKPINEFMGDVPFIKWYYEATTEDELTDAEIALLDSINILIS